MSTDREYQKKLQREVNLSHCEKGIYPLSKEPKGLYATDDIVGIGPGMYTFNSNYNSILTVC
jgi:hypothetical protein